MDLGEAASPSWKAGRRNIQDAMACFMANMIILQLKVFTCHCGSQTVLICLNLLWLKKAVLIYLNLL